MVSWREKRISLWSDPEDLLETLQFFTRPASSSEPIVMSITSCILESMKVGSIPLFRTNSSELMRNSWRLSSRVDVGASPVNEWEFASQPSRSSNLSFYASSTSFLTPTCDGGHGVVGHIE